MMKSRRTKVRLEFVYLADEPTDSIPMKMHPIASRGGINGFVVAGLKALGIEDGAIEGGAKWHVTHIPEETRSRTTKKKRSHS